MSLIVDIEKQYRGFQLRTSFSTESGCLGILGASGCGKSMTLRCIAGLLKPDRGRIELNGRVLFDSEKKINLPPQKRKVGYLFQNYALFPHMTVRENVEAGMQGMTKAAKRSRADRLLAEYHLSELADRYPAQLSWGQQQRTALVRILASDPEYLLLDEPFSALDGYMKDRMQVQLRDMLSEYRGGSILVSHDRREVRAFCDEILVLHEGRVAEFGAPAELFRRPKTMAGAGLSGIRNFSPVTMTDRGMEAEHWGVVLEPHFLMEAAEESLSGELIAAIADGFLLPAEEGEPGAIPVSFHDGFEDETGVHELYRILNEDGCDTGRELWILRSAGAGADLQSKAHALKIRDGAVMLLRN